MRATTGRRGVGAVPDEATRGKAVQVEHIRLTLVLKALGCQPVESTSPFKVLVSDVNLHPYTADAAATDRQLLEAVKVGAEEVQARPRL